MPRKLDLGDFCYYQPLRTGLWNSLHCIMSEDVMPVFSIVEDVAYQSLCSLHIFYIFLDELNLDYDAL